MNIWPGTIILGEMLEKAAYEQQEILQGQQKHLGIVSYLSGFEAKEFTAGGAECVVYEADTKGALTRLYVIASAVSPATTSCSYTVEVDELSFTVSGSFKGNSNYGSSKTLADMSYEPGKLHAFARIDKDSSPIALIGEALYIDAPIVFDHIKITGWSSCTTAGFGSAKIGIEYIPIVGGVVRKVTYRQPAQTARLTERRAA